MKKFYGTPVYQSDSISNNNQYLLTIENPDIDILEIKDGIEQNKLVLFRSMPFESAATLFSDLVNRYGLKDSFDVQMQFVVHLMEDRAPVDNVAVTVNERGPFQIIQHHAEGDSTSQLDLFGLHCIQNVASGGENILSLINQTANHSKLRAKEKVIIGSDLSDAEIRELRSPHLDAKDIIEHCSSSCRVLKKTQRGSVVVKPTPIKATKSAINGEDYITYWDNVTVHDHAFHRHQYELLRYLDILQEGTGSNYESYMHVENDSDWAPADTDSGDIDQTAKLFSCHILHKMEANDFLVFNNRAWTHSVNNWHPEQVRELRAMYA